MSIMTSFQRVTRKAPCPVCSRPDWCLVGIPGTDWEHTAICPRVSSRRRFGEVGYLHEIAAPSRKRPDRAPITVRLASPGHEDKFSKLAALCFAEGGRRASADRLGVSETSLALLGAGELTPRLSEEFNLRWAAGATTFPMSSARGNIVGIRLRLRDGSKRAVTGSREGLFLPQEPCGSELLVVCEGPSDTAAMLDLGFDAIGRPSCTGGTAEVLKFVSHRRTRNVVVLADRDEAGERGATRLAAALVTRVKRLRLIQPPLGIKDARDWKRAGATKVSVQQVMDSAVPWSLAIRIAAGRR